MCARARIEDRDPIEGEAGIGHEQPLQTAAIDAGDHEQRAAADDLDATSARRKRARDSCRRLMAAVPIARIEVPPAHHPRRDETKRQHGDERDDEGRREQARSGEKSRYGGNSVTAANNRRSEADRDAAERAGAREQRAFRHEVAR